MPHAFCVSVFLLFPDRFDCLPGDIRQAKACAERVDVIEMEVFGEFPDPGCKASFLVLIFQIKLHIRRILQLQKWENLKKIYAVSFWPYIYQIQNERPKGGQDSSKAPITWGGDNAFIHRIFCRRGI